MMPMAEYIKLPAVSASLLKTLLTRCPRAAWFESWLNPFPPPADDSDASDGGSIAHAILLEGSASIMEVIDPALYPTKSSGNIPDGWTNKEIKAARDYARAQGKIPVLKAKAAEIESMVLSAQAFIASLKETEPAIWQAFQTGGGESETTLTWDEGGTLCKIRPDRISTDRTLIVDLKFTGTSAEPDGWGRTQMIRMAYYISAAWYRRGVKAAFGTDCEYYFLVVENTAPYLCSLVGVDAHAKELGALKVDHALREWKACCVRHQWPGYPTRACYPEIPAWVDAEWLEKQIEDGVDYGSQG